MKAVSELVSSLHDVFGLFGQIQAKRMFGGYGVYREGVMFALVVDDVLYLKADEESASWFVELGLAQFEYEKGGRKVKMSYFAAPEGIFGDPVKAKLWADRAYGAALRAKKSG
jgi:DNA transformation protein